MSTTIHGLHRNQPVLDPHSKTNSKKDFKNIFLEKIDNNANILGYIPLFGTGTGIRRIYKALTLDEQKNNRTKEILRGTVEVVGGGILLLLLDTLIKTVKAVSDLIKNKKKPSVVASKSVTRSNVEKSASPLKKEASIPPIPLNNQTLNDPKLDNQDKTVFETLPLSKETLLTTTVNDEPLHEKGEAKQETPPPSPKLDTTRNEPLHEEQVAKQETPPPSPNPNTAKSEPLHEEQKTPPSSPKLDTAKNESLHEEQKTPPLSPNPNTTKNESLHKKGRAKLNTPPSSPQLKNKVDEKNASVKNPSDDDSLGEFFNFNFWSKD